MFRALAVLLVTIIAISVVNGFNINRTPLKRSAAVFGVKIVPGEDEAIENVLRRFKRGVSQSGHLAELRFKEQWENAHDKKKRKTERARMLNRIERTNDRYERRNFGEGEYNS
mmetsp:Transcript_24687/g.24912  ORF Transcript_24687/g.24912 Transcript_24687/m.24912 type:complete len:113 (-) Transcript_24687:77-415(-)